jgi:nucleotide-binding universal stress UspA family protein
MASQILGDRPSASEPKTIVAFLDASTAGKARLEAALDVCALFGAHLVGLFVQFPPNAPAGDTSARAFARGGHGMDEAICAYLNERDDAIAIVRGWMDAGARRRGLSCEWRTIDAGTTLREASLQCSYSDLTFLSSRAPGGVPWPAAELVLASGIPGILVPPAWAAPVGRRIAVAWNASRPARRALGDALPFLVRAERVAVIVVDAHVGITAHGEEPGADVAQLLARHAVHAEVILIAADGEDVPRTIASRALAFGADLLVAGAYGHSRFVEFVLGSTTRALVEVAKLPLLISH